MNNNLGEISRQPKVHKNLNFPQPNSNYNIANRKDSNITNRNTFSNHNEAYHNSNQGWDSEKESLKKNNFMRDDYFFQNHSEKTQQPDFPSMIGNNLDSDDSFKILARYGQWGAFCRKLFHLGVFFYNSN